MSARDSMGSSPQTPPEGALPAALAALFEAWLAAAVARFVPPLVFAEVRKGVQAISALYVERRREGRLGPRASEGVGKRAALATFYAPLHFLVAHAAVRARSGVRHGAGARAPRRIVDLGCGTGATGAAVATALAAAGGPAPDLLAIDASGWALSEAQHTHRAFGLRAHTRRGALPAALPRAQPGDLLVLGWFANELDPAARASLLVALDDACARGAGLLVLEPLARGVAPWWDAAAARLAPHGVEASEIKIAPELPDWIRRLDEAAGLDHQQIGARVLQRTGE